MFKPWIPPVQHVAQAQAAYGSDGYVLLDDVFTPEEARQLERIIDEVSDPASEVASKVWHYEWVNCETEDRRRVLGRCEDFVHHPGWSELVDHKLLPIATALLGEPATLAKEKIHPKHPGAAGFRAHQDAAAYSVRERKENGVGGVVEDIWTDSSGDAVPIVSLMVCADPHTATNGPTEVIAGVSTKQLLACTPEGLIDSETEATLDWKPCEAVPTQVMAFGGYVPHRSGPNVSKDTRRRSAFLTFHAASFGETRAKYYAGKHAGKVGGGAPGKGKISATNHWQAVPAD